MSDSVRPQRRQPTRLPRTRDSPGKNTGVGCHFLLQCMKVKSESEVTQSCPTLATPWTAAYQAPPSMGFSRQKYWSGVPLPSPEEDVRGQQMICQMINSGNAKDLVYFTPVMYSVQFSSVTQSCPTFCEPHGLQHSRPSCPSTTPGVYSNSCPLSR